MQLGDQLLGTIPGVVNAEDLVRIPGSAWVVTSGMVGRTQPEGCLHLVNVASHEVHRWSLASSDTDPNPHFGLDWKSFEPKAFAPHGLDLLADLDGQMLLYVINHGGRESVEVFEILVREGEVPDISHVGSVISPARVSGNDLAVTRDGGFVLTNMFDPTDRRYFRKLTSRAITGNVLQWRPGADWQEVVGTAMSGPNGIALSPNEDIIYVGGWPDEVVARFQLSGDEPMVTWVPVGMHTDNLTWAPDGKLLATGQREEILNILQDATSSPTLSTPFRVVEIDPVSMSVQIVIDFDESEEFGCGTTAIHVGDEMWVGSSHHDRLARFGRR